MPSPARAFPGRAAFDPRRVILTDLPLKAAAFGVAVMLWAAVAQAAPRETTLAFAGHIPVERPEVPAGLVLRGALGDVGVRLRGPSDAVERVGQDQLRATIDLAGLTPAAEPQEAPIRVAALDGRVTVIDVAPATVPVRLERLETRALAVQARLANEPPRGFQPGDATVAPIEVRVSGAASLVASVAAVYATVRFGDVGVDVVQSAPVQPVDAAGAIVEGVQVEPAAVQVNVPVLATSGTRTVAVVWSVRGTPAAGFWITRVTAVPAAVTVRGDPRVLAGVEQVDASVDVGGLAASRTVRVPIALPTGVSLVQPLDATITVTVAPLTGARPFPLVPVMVAGLDASLQAEVEPRTVEIVVSGLLAAVVPLAAEQVTATVDVGARGAGTYLLDVTGRTPAGSVQSVQPARVTVTIRAR